MSTPLLVIASLKGSNHEASTPPIGGECFCFIMAGVEAHASWCFLGFSKPLMRLANWYEAVSSPLLHGASRRGECIRYVKHLASWSPWPGSEDHLIHRLNSELHYKKSLPPARERIATGLPIPDQRRRGSPGRHGPLAGRSHLPSTRHSPGPLPLASPEPGVPIPPAGYSLALADAAPTHSVDQREPFHPVTPEWRSTHEPLV